MDQELIEYLDRRFESLDRRFESIDQRFETMDERIEEGFRHNGILIEDLRYQIQLVAEGFTTFVEGRYAEDQARIDRRFDETHALIRSSYDHLDQRIRNLERN